MGKGKKKAPKTKSLFKEFWFTVLTAVVANLITELILFLLDRL